MWIANNWKDYEVIDTSDGEKLSNAALKELPKLSSPFSNLSHLVRLFFIICTSLFFKIVSNHHLRLLALAFIDC